MIGKPALFANAAISSNDFTGSVSPGTTGTPAACMRCRDSVFDPMASIDSGDGPMKVSPASAQARATAAFSAGKPYPGWVAGGPVGDAGGGIPELAAGANAAQADLAAIGDDHLHGGAL